MSNVQVDAPRLPHDLDHFCYSSGAIGRLKVLSTVPVIAGDSFSMNMVGAFRLAPLRRGLSIDSHVDLFSFFIPYRHIYGDDWIKLMKEGVPVTGAPAASLPADDVPTPDPNSLENGFDIVDFLGTRANPNTRKIPKYLYQSYLQIYNNYFKSPYSPDTNTTLSALAVADRKDGFRVSHLDAYWTKPLNPNVDTSARVEPDPAGQGMDIMGLNAAYARLHTQQERDNFMQRYRDIMDSFGGSTYYDADNRPLLLNHTSFWGSGYDVDGSTQETLGQFSGRVQQQFSHAVPRAYIPEHGVVMTLMCVRFPPINPYEMHRFVGKATLDYFDVAGDPVIVGNLPPREEHKRYVFCTESPDKTWLTPEAQYYRYHPSHVDERYMMLKGFPFVDYVPDNDVEQVFVRSEDYDKVFQTTQLGQWNIQSKFNVSVLRNLPTARESIITS